MGVTVDKVGVDKMGVDKMGSRPSGTTTRTTALLVLSWWHKIHIMYKNYLCK